jgi:glycosyltransferase involved in cell wall biosynthesis
MGENMRLETISVCMATYNGSKYLTDQINSIINQLIDGDEFIIIDDCSTDSTLSILKSIEDSRIKVIANKVNLGVNKSFEKAIASSKNEFIFMADQDDIWPENRAKKMLEILKGNDINLVSGNSRFIDSDGNDLDYPIIALKEYESRKTSKNLFRIFLGTGAYSGCAMAFKRELLSAILPFPNYIESHDLWIAKASILQKKSYHLEDIVLYRRIHGRNASIIKRPLIMKIRSRFIFLMSILDLIFRNMHNRKLLRNDNVFLGKSN